MLDRPSLAPFGRMFRAQFRAEVLRLRRNRGFTLFSLLLPLIFYTLFALPNLKGHLLGANLGLYLMAVYAGYGCVSVMLSNFGVAIANERLQRANVLLKASPISPLTYLLAKLASSLLYALILIAVMVIYGTSATGLNLPLGQLLDLAVRLLLGALPFVFLGFALGQAANPDAGQAVINLVNLVISFLSGLLVPLASLPHFVQGVAKVLPGYWYAQLIVQSLGAKTQPLGELVLVLTAYSAALLLLAVWAYRRQEEREFS